jgi:LysM domain
MQTTVNDIKHMLGVCRGAAVLLGALVLAPWLWHVAEEVGAASAAGVPVRSDEALVAVLASAALVGVGWLALSVLLELLCLVPGALGHFARRVADLVTPRLLRRAAGALLGVGVVAGLAPGASVATPAVHLVRGGGALGQAADAALPDPGFSALPDPGWAPTPPEPEPTSGGWVPTRPTVRTQPDVRVLSPSPRSTTASQSSEVVVRRGDSLWSVAARHLGHDASDAEIAQAWPAWFETNRAVIGDDPDVLRPGQVLRPPPRSLP